MKFSPPRTTSHLKASCSRKIPSLRFPRPWSTVAWISCRRWKRLPHFDSCRWRIRWRSCRRISTWDCRGIRLPRLPVPSSKRRWWARLVLWVGLFFLLYPAGNKSSVGLFLWPPLSRVVRIGIRNFEEFRKSLQLPISEDDYLMFLERDFCFYFFN